MSNKGVRFTLNIANFGKEVMKSPQLLEILEAEAEQMATHAGVGYEATATMGRKRALARVSAVTMGALVDNSDNNTLLKVIK